MPKVVAVGLVRCSTDRQEHSIDDQEAEIRRYCEERGYQLKKVFDPTSRVLAMVKRREGRSQADPRTMGDASTSFVMPIVSP